METVFAIFKKEFKSYFNSPVAYIFITIFLGLTNWLFFMNFFLIGQSSMRAYFDILPWVFLFFVPAVTMRMWAEEKKLGTIELLLTWPVKDAEIVIGKFLASLLFLVITVLSSITIPITIAILGDIEVGPIVASYLGSFLMGAAYLAIGLFISSLTENQIVAFIMAVFTSFLFFMVGEPFITAHLPLSIASVATFIGMGTHFDSISRGVLDTRDLFYYFSIIGFFLFLNVRSIASRNWK